MNVLFAATECVPFVKTGGLADVIGALPAALNRIGVNTAVILPKYQDISAKHKAKMELIAKVNVPVGWRNQYCGIETLKHEGIRFYFLDNEYYFKRNGSYGYDDDGERFAFFSRAVLESLPHLHEKPDVLHCNDWQTGPVSVLLQAHFQNRPFYASLKTVFTIHNLRYQGIYPKAVLSDLLDLSELYFHPDGLEFYGNVSYLKAGLAYSDVLTTVSPTYAEEIKTGYFGEQLDGFLRKRSNDLHGILNGIDTELYNPETDSHLPARFNDFSGKRLNKENLQAWCEWPADSSVPLIGMVTRLTDQKGIDLVLRVFQEMLSLRVQFVLLGTGESAYEDAFRSLERENRDQVRAFLYFDESLARKIYGASDLFLMPSLFEPCGIGQLLALRYGSLPIVRETGGLRDTVIPYNDVTDEGYGFSFSHYNAHDMLYTVERAVGYYRYQPKTWHKLVDRAMNQDFSWIRSSEHYKQLYESIV
ncbi:MAG TPA: glycogen synthase GlgA [Bacillales bacterium]|nr:glycogen synthase GlgA [Bacillales bacterium]